MPRGREYVHHVLIHCRTCRCYGGGPCYEKRELSHKSPFTNIGLDYFGSIYIKALLKGNQKTLVCLFTYSVTTSLHLELVQDLTTSSFLTAFQRFCLKCKVPWKILSDNVAQFKLADPVLKKLWDDLPKDPQVASHLVDSHIS